MPRSLTQWFRQCVAALRPQPSLSRAPLARFSAAPDTASACSSLARATAAPARVCVAPRTPGARTPSTRIIEWETAANGSARTLGRVVMVGKFSEICAELDRLAALEMA